MDDILGTYEILVVQTMLETLSMHGYNPTTTTVRILRKHLLEKFGLKSLREATEEQFSMMMMYLEQWRPSARMRFRLREHRYMKLEEDK